MSDVNQARRASVQVVFAGTDITEDIRPYLIGVDYTDNEEDEADDLQIKLQDRDAVWLKKWLNELVQKAASTSRAQSSGTATSTYRVTPAIGLNVRTGPGTGYRKLGALVCGTKVEVYSISNGWAQIRYSGQTAYVSANYLTPVNGASGSSSGSSASSSVSGMKISAVIVQQNWHGDGKDNVLSCGEFELDSISAGVGPSDLTIKGTSIPYASTIRQQKKTKGWEAYYLEGIAAEIAANGGMGLLYLSANNPYYNRREQFRTPDTTFLKNLCHDAGVSMKITNNIIVLYDQAAYEKRDAVLTIKYGDGSYVGKPQLRTGKAETQYASCRVRYTNPATGKCIQATAYVEDYKADDKKNQQLEVPARVSNYAEAKSLAEKRLRLHNKFERTASFTLLGNSELVAGLNVKLEGFGMWDGKYVIKTAKHSVGGSGYTTAVTLRPALEG